ncbi:MAG TPA: peptidase M16 [Desulfobacterales bacterium]|nr:peptidase M16 [Desulfobacterales bacterium]
MYQKTVLPHGIRVVTEALPHFHSVSLGIWLNTGSRDETAGENGMAHFLEHMAFKGTGRRSASELACQIDQLGGTANAFTTQENTCFHGKVLAAELPRLFDLLSDILLNPVYDTAELEKERQVILQEIDELEDTPDEYVHVLFNRHFYGDSAFGRPIMGSADTVCNFTRLLLLDYRQSHYHPQDIVIAAAGRLEHEALVNLAAAAFGDFHNCRCSRPRQKVATYPGGHNFLKDLEQVHLVAGGKAPAAGEDSRYMAILLNLILGGNMSSRLFQEIRERQGLCYSIYSFLHCFSDAGLLAISASVSPENFEQLLDTIRREIEALKTTGVSPQELQAAVDYSRASLYLSAEDSDNRMMRLARNELSFGHYLSYEEIIDHLASVTPHQIIEKAQDWLDLGSWQIVCLGPLKASTISIG